VFEKRCTSLFYFAEEMEKSTLVRRRIAPHHKAFTLSVESTKLKRASLAGPAGFWGRSPFTADVSHLQKTLLSKKATPAEKATEKARFATIANEAVLCVGSSVLDLMKQFPDKTTSQAIELASSTLEATLLDVHKLICSFDTSADAKRRSKLVLQTVLQAHVGKITLPPAAVNATITDKLKNLQPFERANAVLRCCVHLIQEDTKQTPFGASFSAVTAGNATPESLFANVLNASTTKSHEDFRKERGVKLNQLFSQLSLASSSAPDATQVQKIGHVDEWNKHKRQWTLPEIFALYPVMSPAFAFQLGCHLILSFSNITVQPPPPPVLSHIRDFGNFQQVQDELLSMKSTRVTGATTATFYSMGVFHFVLFAVYCFKNSHLSFDEQVRVLDGLSAPQDHASVTPNTFFSGLIHSFNHYILDKKSKPKRQMLRQQISLLAKAHVPTAVPSVNATHAEGVYQEFASSAVSEEEVIDVLKDSSIDDGTVMSFFLENDIGPFFETLGFRPHKRYMMGTMIHMNAYGEAGKTFYGLADFQLSDNVAQKTHFGHFTMYAKSVVMFPQYIVRADNIVCLDYVGGNGHLIWNPANDDHVDSYRANELICDVFMVPIIRGTWTPNWHIMDISGRYNERVSPNAEARASTDYGPMAAILGEIWGWRAIISPQQKDYFAQFAPKFNTVVFQEHQKLYDPNRGDYSVYKIDRGHWGSRVYPGCGEVRRGNSLYFLPVSYDNTRVTVIGL
jgi:hypothetical protein